MMMKMGYFQAANVGPLWMQVNEPKGEDLPLAFANCRSGTRYADTVRRCATPPRKPTRTGSIACSAYRSGLMPRTG